jgi:Ras-related protein Rab-2A
MADGADASHFTFKFIILGDTSVGKSCIISRYRDNQFTTTHDVTIGVTFTNQRVNIGTAELKLQLWDTAGQEIYRSITRSYYRDSDCAIIVCDLTKAESFAVMPDWVEDVRSLAPERCQIVIVGSKLDLAGGRQVSTDKLRKFAGKINCPFFETSAKTGENITALFDECAMLAYTEASMSLDAARRDRDTLALWVPSERPKRRCC